MPKPAKKTNSDKTPKTTGAMRYDVGKIVERQDRFTPEGFLKVTAVVTRTGVFNYRNVDGSLRRELRHPDDVMLEDSLDTMKMIPMTNQHPQSKLVNQDNVKQLSIGFTGESVKPDGKFIKIPVTITDRKAVDDVMEGRDELSLGYEIDLFEEAGDYDGERYDFRQRNIRYNHLAIVDAARAGSAAKIHLDSDDAIEDVEGSDIASRIVKKDVKKPGTKKTDKNHSPQQRSRAMGKFVIDGIDYEADQEVINHAKSQRERGDNAEAETVKVNKDKDTIEAERDDLKKKLDESEKKSAPEAVRQAINDRLDIERKAATVLDEETCKKLAEMDDKAIITAVVQTANKDVNLDGKSDDYVAALFDIACNDAAAKDKKGDKGDGTGGQRQQINKSTNTDEDGEADSYKTRDDAFTRLQNRSRGIKEPEKTAA